MRLLPALVAVMGSAIAVVSPAVASAAGWQPLGSRIHVVADGTGLAAWQDEAGDTRVLPDGQPVASARPLATPAGCALRAAGAGMLVVDCASGGTVRPTFVDVRTGATSEPPGLADLVSYQHAAGADGDAPAFESEAVGSRWLRIAVASSHSEEHVFLDWRFGRFVAQEPRLSDTTVESLDTPSRTARLCRPLEVRRGAAREPGRATLFSYAYRAPWLVWVDRLRARSVTTIQRCGRRARSLGAGTPVLLTRRYVAWISRGRLDLRYLATGRRSSVALPEGRRTGALVGTDHRLFLSQSFLDQVYARDLP